MGEGLGYKYYKRGDFQPVHSPHIDTWMRDRDSDQIDKEQLGQSTQRGMEISMLEGS